jgi:hypothetical protein
MNAEVKVGTRGPSPNAWNAASRFQRTSPAQSGATKMSASAAESKFLSLRSIVSGVAVAAMAALAASGAAYAQTTGDGESIGSGRGR